MPFLYLEGRGFSYDWGLRTRDRCRRLRTSLGSWTTQWGSFQSWGQFWATRGRNYFKSYSCEFSYWACKNVCVSNKLFIAETNCLLLKHWGEMNEISLSVCSVQFVSLNFVSTMCPCLSPFLFHISVLSPIYSTNFWLFLFSNDCPPFLSNVSQGHLNNKIMEYPSVC